MVLAFNFKGIIERFDDSLWSFHIKIPSDIHQQYKDAKIKRVMVSIDNGEPIHCGFMPAGEGIYFVMLSKKVMKDHELGLGQKVKVDIVTDTSKYGMRISEEFEELLLQDVKGSDLFHALTPGKMRSLIHKVNTYKSMDKRIEMSIRILDHLKANDGTLDWKMLLSKN